jgi:DNA-binding transcriptional regulator YiaG
MYSEQNQQTRTISIASRQVVRLRDKLQISIVGLAQILGLEPSTIEAWESPRANRRCPFPIKELEYRVNAFVSEHGGLPPSPNLLFGHFEIVVARKLSGQDVRDFAEDFGVSEAVWKKFESDRRVLPNRIRRKLEQLVEERFSCIALSNNSTD